MRGEWLLIALAGCASPGEPFAVRVVSFEPGTGAGFGQDRLPAVVLGPPRGAGEVEGSLDVVSLGVGGSIVVELGADAVDLPGPDLIVFENAFRAFGGNLYKEPGIVALSVDGDAFVELACDPESGAGCAGVAPVFAHADDNDLDPTDPAVAGGDPIDLGPTGLARARFVRITDAEAGSNFGTDNFGFDLDAVAVVHPR
jgi:hypothetical protein